MGYYTNHSLTVLNGTGGEIEHLKRTCDNADYALGSGDSCKWYEHDDDMLRFSKLYPDATFVLSGEGEEAGDVWKTYYKNGKMQHCPGKITFDEFDESKLEAKP